MCAELCAIMAGPLHKGWKSFGESAEEVYQNAAWIREYKKRLEKQIVLSGTAEVEGRPNRSLIK